MITIDRLKELAFACGKMKGDILICDRTWCLGGTCRSYGGWENPARVEPTPVSCGELEDILLVVMPNISALQLNKIYRTCVSTSSRRESDYYGSDVFYGYYEIDLDKLCEILNSFGV